MCNASSPPYVLKRLLSAEEFERWGRLALEKALDSMSDLFYCPRCVIGCLLFCSFCKEPCHPGKQCLTPEQKLLRRQASGRMTEREMAQELLNIRKPYRDVRLCPKCRMAISKTEGCEGCNKMVGGNCGQYFCFRCGKAISGYEHFRNCQLYAPRDIMEWGRRMGRHL